MDQYGGKLAKKIKWADKASRVRKEAGE